MRCWAEVAEASGRSEWLIDNAALHYERANRVLPLLRKEIAESGPGVDLAQRLLDIMAVEWSWHHEWRQEWSREWPDCSQRLGQLRPVGQTPES